MKFVPLTPLQKRSFESDGFLVIRNALKPEHIQQLLAAGDRLATSFLNKPQLSHKPWHNDLDLRPGLLLEEALYSLISHPPIVSLVVQLLSPNIHLHSTSLVYKKPEAPNLPPFRRGWHRDLRIPRDLGHNGLPQVGVKVCYCLTDFQQADSGMTLMARGSHLTTAPLAIPSGEVDPLQFDTCDLGLNVGDALLFENRIFHTANPNRSDRIAKRVIYGYSYRWMKPEVYLDPPDPTLLDRADPITRQLLGGYRDIDTPPWALQAWTQQHGVCPERVPWTVDV